MKIIIITALYIAVAVEVGIGSGKKTTTVAEEKRHRLQERPPTDWNKITPY